MCVIVRVCGCQCGAGTHHQGASLRRGNTRTPGAGGAGTRSCNRPIRSRVEVTNYNSRFSTPIRAYADHSNENSTCAEEHSAGPPATPPPTHTHTHTHTHTLLRHRHGIWRLPQENELRDLVLTTSIHSVRCLSLFHHVTITKPFVRDLVVVEVSSHTARMVPVHSYNSFLDQRSQKVV